LDTALIHRLAQALDDAERTRTQIPHFSRQYPDMGIEDGYAVQRTWVDMKLKAGRRLVGHKNGLIEESGVAAAVLNHPANGVVWLANKLVAHDIGLEPGQIILSGSFTRPV